MAVAYVNKGEFAQIRYDLTVGVPTGYTAGNLFLLFVESANQAVPTPASWTQIGSMSGEGVAGATGVGIQVFYKWVTSSESAVTIPDSGDHQSGIILEFSGVNTTNPINNSADSVKSAHDTTVNCPSVTTSVANTMIVCAIGLNTDLVSSDNITGALTNNNLSDIQERCDNTSTNGTGGGIAVITGLFASTGASGTTTGGAGTCYSGTHAYKTIALAPIFVPAKGSRRRRNRKMLANCM